MGRLTCVMEAGSSEADTRRQRVTFDAGLPPERTNYAATAVRDTEKSALATATQCGYFCLPTQKREPTGMTRSGRRASAGDRRVDFGRMKETDETDRCEGWAAGGIG